MTEGIVVISTQSVSKVRTRLQELILDKNLMRPLSIARLATLIGISSHLRFLSLRSCGIDDGCFTTICERFPMTKKLHKIDFTDNQITDVSIEGALAPLMMCVLKPPFTHLTFTQN